ncbi:hypothetical protein AwErysi_01710 [Erysipelotrichaceae bacterium]|nr:hypothetical protein AwErysi_01710 [Erysipelotrichaceae bacterium]
MKKTLEKSERMEKIREKVTVNNSINEYQRVAHLILSDSSLVSLFEQYRTTQSAYLIQRERPGEKEKADLFIEELKQQKTVLLANDDVSNYFMLGRKITFFADELNFELNKIIKTEKSGCK